jgi:hypothetical protein
VVIPSHEKSFIPIEENLMPIQKSHTFGVMPSEEEKLFDYMEGQNHSKDPNEPDSNL